MLVRIIEMIRVDPPKGNTLHVISDGISPGFLAEFSQAHEDAGFDLVLVGDYSSSSEVTCLKAQRHCQVERGSCRVTGQLRSLSVDRTVNRHQETTMRSDPFDSDILRLMRE
jgi:hypothetical protein